jgi:hypothetical protein
MDERKYLHEAHKGSSADVWFIRDERGAWYRDPSGVDAGLYGSDVTRGDVVHITEGHSDCDALRALGLTAVTSGGATTWAERHTTYVNGASVFYIYEDHDDAGRTSINHIGSYLENTGARIRVCTFRDLWEKADVKDALASGRTIDEIMSESVTLDEWRQERTEANWRRPKRSTWERYPVPALEILRSGLKPTEKLAYIYADAIQGTDGHPLYGVGKLAEGIDVDERTASAALEKLAEVGLMDPHRRVTESGKGYKATVLEVTHSPIRGRVNPKGVRLPEPRITRTSPDDPATRKAKGTFRKGGTPAVPVALAQEMRQGVGGNDPGAIFVGAAEFPASENAPGLGNSIGSQGEVIPYDSVTGDIWK